MGTQQLDLADLVLGGEVRMGFIDSSLLADCVGCAAAVTGQHDKFQPLAVEFVEGRDVVLRDLVGHGDDATAVFIVGDEYSCLSALG